MKKYLKDDNENELIHFYSSNRHSEDTAIDSASSKLDTLDIDSQLKPDDEFSESRENGKNGDSPQLDDREVRNLNLDQITHTLKPQTWQNIMNKTVDTLSVAEFKKILKEEQNQEHDEKSFSERSLIGKLVYLTIYPFDKLSTLTIPSVEEERISGKLVWLFPFSSILMIITLNGCKCTNLIFN